MPGAAGTAAPIAVVQAHPPRDLGHVGADLLADVGDLVDEADLGGEEGVGGELDHLGAGDVGADDRRAERLVGGGDRVGGPLVARLGADHDAVGLHEVLDRGALAQELGAGDVGDARARSRWIVRPVPTGTVLFITRARPSPSPISSTAGHHGARGRRRRSGSAASATQTKISRAASSSSSISVVKVSRSEFLLDQLGQAGLVDRHLAAPQRLDLLGDDLAGHHAVAQLGEAGGGDQADPADADDADRLSFAHRRSFSAERYGQRLSRRRAWAARHALGDLDHLAVGERLDQRVGDPERALVVLPGDDPQAVAVVVELVGRGRRSPASRRGRRGSAGPSSGSP